MDWVCSGVKVDWEAWSVLVAVTVFLWDQRSKRLNRRAAGRLMARLLIPELKHLKEQLAAIQAQLNGAWPPGGPSAALRDELIEDFARVATPSLDRGLDDLASLPANVTDKVTSAMGWLSQLKSTPYMDPSIPYGLGNWHASFQEAKGLLQVAIKTCEAAILEARKVGAPPSLVDRFWRWPRQEKAAAAALRRQLRALAGSTGG